VSDLSGIGYLVALLYLFVIFLAFLKGVIEQWRNRNKKPKTSVSKLIFSKSIINNESEEKREIEEDYVWLRAFQKGVIKRDSNNSKDYLLTFSIG
jgi:hypothetical protein